VLNKKEKIASWISSTTSSGTPRKKQISSKHFIYLGVGLVYILPSHIGLASVAEFQAAAATNAELLHQFTFDGASEEARRQDKTGNLGVPLEERFTDTGTAEDLTYGALGFDESSEAVGTFRANPGESFSPNGPSAAFSIPQTTLENSFSYEVIFKTHESELDGGAFDLAYILSNRSADGNNRGYFLMQGSSGPSFGADGSDISSLIGDSFAPSNENTIVETVEADHWYYVAGSYRTDGVETTFTNYVADLTAGETTLTAVGPLTVAGSFSTEAGPFGIGTRYDATGEALNGCLDEVNLYSTELGGDQFQANLDLITGGAVPFVITAVDYDPDADTVTLTWRSRPNTSYSAFSSFDLSDWSNELADSLGAAEDENPDDGNHITVTFSLENGLEDATDLFLRIQEE